GDIKPLDILKILKYHTQRSGGLSPPVTYFHVIVIVSLAILITILITIALLLGIQGGCRRPVFVLYLNNRQFVKMFFHL
ncbi:MAG: hypothetical protein LBH05_05065, partial [Deferribacteraceae bacterium]|nr:hypothetical protein [Deferribacteraceae bacterium]